MMLILIVGCTQKIKENKTEEIQEPIKDPEPQEPTQSTEPTREQEPVSEPKKQEPVEIKEDEEQDIEYEEYIDISLEEGNINRGIMSPDYITIQKGQKVRWTNRNIRPHLVACYLESKRIFAGEKITPEEYSEHTFEQTGEYICKDAIYGSRGTIIVE